MDEDVKQLNHAAHIDEVLEAMLSGLAMSEASPKGLSTPDIEVQERAQEPSDEDAYEDHAILISNQLSDSLSKQISDELDRQLDEQLQAELDKYREVEDRSIDEELDRQLQDQIDAMLETSYAKEREDEGDDDSYLTPAEMLGEREGEENHFVSDDIPWSLRSLKGWGGMGVPRHQLEGATDKYPAGILGIPQYSQEDLKRMVDGLYGDSEGDAALATDTLSSGVRTRSGSTRGQSRRR